MKNRMEPDRRLGLFCLAVTFLWGFAAHGYLFANNLLAHDSLAEIDAAGWGNRWKIQLGRVLVPLYRQLTRSAFTLPWLIGLFSLLWLTGTLFLTAKLFGMKSGVQIALTGGVLVTNATVIAQAATYLNDLDGNLFGLLCAVLAVFCWQNLRRGWLWGMPLLMICCGLYQSYLSVAITLIMLLCIRRLLSGERCAGAVLLHGVKGVGMLAGGGVLYLGVMALVLKLADTELASGSENSLTNITGMASGFAKNLKETYTLVFDRLLEVPGGFEGTPAGLLIPLPLIAAAVLVLLRFCRPQVGPAEKLLVLALTALLPLGMNLSHLLSGGSSHDLMRYAFWLAYVAALAVLWPGAARLKAPGLKKLAFGLAGLCLGVFLLGNVQLANMAYMSRDLNNRATFSLMTRVLARMETMEDYVPGETPVLFVGQTRRLTARPDGDFYHHSGLTGCYQDTLGAADNNYYAAYLDHVMQARVELVSNRKSRRLKDLDEVQEMPLYPDEDCMQFIDDVLVVKLGKVN